MISLRNRFNHRTATYNKVKISRSHVGFTEAVPPRGFTITSSITGPQTEQLSNFQSWFISVQLQTKTINVTECNRINNRKSLSIFKHKNKNKTKKNYNQVKNTRYTEHAISQLTFGDNEVSGQDISTMVNNLTKDQIQGVIAYFNSKLQPLNTPSVPSSSGATITASPGLAYSSSTMRLVAILHATSTVLGSTSLIVDNGATHYVTCDKICFESFSVTLNASVTLPTGIWCEN